jgi:hypothetical protein
LTPIYISGFARLSTLARPLRYSGFGRCDKRARANAVKLIKRAIKQAPVQRTLGKRGPEADRVKIEGNWEEAEEGAKAPLQKKK